jgi:5-methylcytosine-specific restriction endonuclease McrA
MNRKYNNQPRKDIILKLRSKGLSYKQIQKKIGCSLSTISYHCGSGSEKARVKKQVKNRKPICKKVSNFKARCTRANYQTLRAKVKTFKKRPPSSNKGNAIVNNISKNYSCKDVINHIGEKPICYLTGLPINLNKPETYHLDHIIPTSKGGTNDLSNLGICLKEANYAKGELSLLELYDLCEKILSFKSKKK